MLTLTDAASLNRRQLLSIGALGGLALPQLLAGKARGEEAGPATGKSVIFLFQQGGPSQFETFDPKPAADASIRTVTGVTNTSLPGVQFGDTMARTAQHADKLTIVRSFQTENAGHNIQPIVGPHSLETNIGVHYARVTGATRPRTGMPTNAILYPSSVSDRVPGPEARGDLKSTGAYGSGFAPFVPGAGGQFQQSMQLAIPRDRFGDRRLLLEQMDQLRRRRDEQLAAAGEIQSQAYEVLLGGGVSRALDLSLEDPRVLAKYDTSPYVRPGAWNKVSRGKKGYYNAQAACLGKLLLMARRLCEAACGFVTIHAGYAGVWDMHADGNNLNMADGMQAVGRSFDHAVAAFVEDLEQRGQANDILLVACGEMGRTPKINNRGGRDHWAKLAPLLLYGGGLPRGQVIGQSDKTGGEPLADPLTPAHLISTILHTVLDIGRLRLIPGVPPAIMKLAEAKTIA